MDINSYIEFDGGGGDGVIFVLPVIWVFGRRMQWQWLEPKERDIQLFEREKSKGSNKFEGEKTCLKKIFFFFFFGANYKYN